MNKDQIREKVINYFMNEEILSGYEIRHNNLDDDLETHGMDSFTFIKLLVGLEQVFNIEIPNEFLIYDKWGTINTMVDSLSVILELN